MRRASLLSWLVLFFGVLCVSTGVAKLATQNPVRRLQIAHNDYNQRGEDAAEAAGSCGVERWNVKTGSDGDAGTVPLGTTTPTTIAAIDAQTAPSSPPANNRVAPYETTDWSLDATLIEYKAETDSDVHGVIEDVQGRTMIIEFPKASCVSASSPMLSRITSARAAFDAQLTATSTFKHTSVPIHLKGPGFWDFAHGQTGHAPNYAEIHPVLAVSFAAASSSPSPTPTQSTGAAVITPAPTPVITLSPSPTASSLPHSGSNTNIFGLSAVTLIEIGVALILLAGWIGSRRYRRRPAR